MSIRKRYFKNTIACDLYDTFVGKRLGKGIDREVFVCKSDPTCVIKIETEARSFQNIMEWELWLSLVPDSPIYDWIAPCVSISPCGTILIQKRTEPINSKTFPEKIPTWAADVKLENWGLLDGKPVMHDYGYLCPQYPNKLRGLRKYEKERM